jgi:hypothetical protein
VAGGLIHDYSRAGGRLCLNRLNEQALFLSEIWSILRWTPSLASTGQMDPARTVARSALLD